MTTDIATTITTREVAEVVLGLDEKAIETFVESLGTEQAEAFTIKAMKVRAAFALAAKIGERSLAIRGVVGQTYTDPDSGTAYLFTDSTRKKWKDVAGMAATLEEYGITPSSIFRAVTELRVTDLRVLADSTFLSEEQKAEVLQVIEDYRETVKSSPSFVELDEHGRIKRG